MRGEPLDVEVVELAEVAAKGVNRDTMGERDVLGERRVVVVASASLTGTVVNDDG